MRLQFRNATDAEKPQRALCSSGLEDLTRLGNMLGKCGHSDYVYTAKERQLETDNYNVQPCHLACASNKQGICPEAKKLSHPNPASELAVQSSG